VAGEFVELRRLSKAIETEVPVVKSLRVADVRISVVVDQVEGLTRDSNSGTERIVDGNRGPAPVGIDDQDGIERCLR